METLLIHRVETRNFFNEQIIALRFFHRILIVFAVITSAFETAVGQLQVPESPLWKQIADEVSPEKIPTRISTERALTAAAFHDDQAYVGDTDGVLRVGGQTLTSLAEVNGTAAQLKSLNRSLYAAGPDGLRFLTGTNGLPLTSQSVMDLCVHNEQLIVASGTELYSFNDDGLRQLASGNHTTRTVRVEGRHPQ